MASRHRGSIILDVIVPMLLFISAGVGIGYGIAQREDTPQKPTKVCASVYPAACDGRKNEGENFTLPEDSEPAVREI